ncbi:MAG: DUF4111 domain-containing protein [Chloroflexi bacterium]|nr:DUF4111 domain-containing protein [Chloroflexota bacterium]MBI4296668.1 DUF4111 domain-containing protein [Chloroflexota bacterium]
MPYPTLYPEVNALLDNLLSAVKKTLGDDFVGMYLHGSLALGDFTPNRSDIDFVVVTANAISDKTFSALQDMHARVATSGLPMATELEGAYVPLNDLRGNKSDKASYPHIDSGSGETLRIQPYGSWWVVERHIFREHGIILVGPAPTTFAPSVLPDELQQAVMEILHQHWAPMLHDPVKLRQAGYQVYAVLTMCRILYTFQHGTIISKSSAATWAAQSLPEYMKALVTKALAWRNCKPFDNLNATLELVRYTLAHAHTRPPH